MSALRSFRRGRRSGFRFVGATLAAVAVFGVLFVGASGAVLPGSPSGFESNDGDMTLGATGGNNTDWNCFVNSDNFAHNAGTPSGCKVTSGATQLTADANGETTWVNGQKFDTKCPALETGTVPNKDDFTNVASFSDMASNNDVFFYGATIRAAANGDSSGDVEFNQQSGNGTTTAGCRTAGDLLLAYDFSVGGTSLDFHILTWIDSTNPTAGGNNGNCFVKTDNMPCWGANELTPVTTEGEANQAAITAAANGISGSALAAEQFAEFGVNLTQALGLSGSCLAFPQLVWESRSSGSSFTSNPEDIEIEHATIDTCAQPTLTTKLSQNSILNTGSVTDTATLADATSDASGAITISVYSGSDGTACTGTPVASKTATPATDGNGDYSASFSGLPAGSYEFQASIAADAKNLSAVSVCGSEPLTVQNRPTIVTSQDPGSGSAGDIYKDRATLSGGASPTGTITFDLFGNQTCSGTPLAEETVPVTNGNDTYETATGAQLDEAGTYYWVASFGGDANNLPARSGCADEPVVVNGASIHILKTADAAKVSAGDPIGFTMTVWNSGAGDAHGVTLADQLPAKPGLDWKVDETGGFGPSCSISSGGLLTCGPVTVPAGTTQSASAFKVHITSGTTAATGGDCPGSGAVDNTGSVTTSNDGSAESGASTCVQALVDLSVTKAGSPATQVLGSGNIVWTIVVTNHGPSDDTGVTISDPMPAGNTFVSATTTKGSCTGGAILNCSIGPMAANESVTITLVTTPSAAGAQTNTVNVAGNRPETNLRNNSATATVQVTAPFVPPPVFCVAVSRVTPKQLFVGRRTKLTIHITRHGRAVRGIHVRVTGPKLNLETRASNGRGVITSTVKMKKAGILVFRPIASERCNTKRVGVTNVFTPPVTG